MTMSIAPSTKDMVLYEISRMLRARHDQVPVPFSVDHINRVMFPLEAYRRIKWLEQDCHEQMFSKTDTIAIPPDLLDLDGIIPSHSREAAGSPIWYVTFRSSKGMLVDGPQIGLNKEGFNERMLCYVNARKVRRIDRDSKVYEPLRKWALVHANIAKSNMVAFRFVREIIQHSSTWKQVDRLSPQTTKVINGIATKIRSASILHARMPPILEMDGKRARIPDPKIQEFVKNNHREAIPALMSAFMILGSDSSKLWRETPWSPDFTGVSYKMYLPGMCL